METSLQIKTRIKKIKHRVYRSKCLLKKNFGGNN